MNEKLDIQNSNVPPRDIAEIVSNFSHVRIATAADNRAILDFIATQSMQTDSFAIGFDRGEDFFAFYKLAGQNFATFLFLNEDRTIGGMGTLLIQDVELAGCPERVGYFCDLRVDAKASSITHVQWRKFYAELVSGLRSLTNVRERCSFLYTSVFDTNERAIRALTKKLKKVRYLPIHAYRTETLLMAPLARLRRDTTKWESATDIAKTDAITPRASLAAAWPSNISRPLVSVCSKSGLVLASCRPWNSDGLRQPKIGGMNRALTNLGRVLPFFGRPAILTNTPLRQIFLTQLHFADGLTVSEKKRALAQLVRGVYRRAVREKIHLISWVETSDLGSSKPSTKTAADVRFSTSAKLYEVVADDQNPRASEFSHLPLYFEGAIL